MDVRRAVPVFDAQDPAASGDFRVELLALEVVIDQGPIITLAAPDNPAAQISLMSEDASASCSPTSNANILSRA